MSRRATLVLAMALAAGPAFVLGFLIAPREEPAVGPPPPDAGLRAEAERLRGENERLRRELAAPAAGAAPAATVPDRAVEPLAGAPAADLLPEDAPDSRRAQARDLAARIREQAQREYEGADATAAWRVREEMEEERRFLEDRARGGTMALLTELAKDGTHLPKLVADRERFAACFARKTEERVIGGEEIPPEDPLADGTTVSLSEGVTRWDAAGYGARQRFPKDLLFRGRGMDRTLLYLNELRSNDEVASLCFEDLTLHCGDNYLTDLRSAHPMTIRMTRCRVVGFDMGAGGSVMLAARTAAFYAEDCRFEAGYGRTRPGFGNLFRVRSGLLARLDRCVFRGPFSSVFEADSAATYLFKDCRFEEMGDRVEAALASPPNGVRLVGCTVVPTPEGRTASAERRPLTDFNPDWN